MDWEAFVHLAFDEIRQAGAGSPQVTRRLIEAISDLESVVPPDRRRALLRQRALLETAVNEVVADERDITFALEGDRQGIGVGAGATRGRQEAVLAD